MRAFAVTTPAFPDMITIYAAESASKARADQWRRSNSAGYRFKIFEFKVKRAPKFDALASDMILMTVLGWDDGLVRWGCLDIRNVHLHIEWDDEQAASYRGLYITVGGKKVWSLFGNLREVFESALRYAYSRQYTVLLSSDFDHYEMAGGGFGEEERAAVAERIAKEYSG